MNGRSALPLSWAGIECVILDMDGTLLDLHVDTQLWSELLPQRVAARLAISVDAAQRAPPLPCGIDFSRADAAMTGTGKGRIKRHDRVGLASLIGS